ncbi:MAG TPA: glycoside hydrolase family 2 TIM barrel-domain containing protein, partial [Flavisolibacter sp.]|nr:glycoside hydrolase family 2 TIM barrel-domain containing protein [Flavisolibacter sp.]
MRFLKFTERSLVPVFIFLQPLILQAQEADRFAEIGNKVAATRMHLLKTPTPPKLPNKILSITTGKRNAFTPMNRLDTPDELQEQLAKKRKQYEPFLQNHAPSLTASRDVIPLTKFNWRIETGADTKNFSDVLQGKGSWEKVAIPHYGPPLGKAVTYYQTEIDLPTSFFRKGAVFIQFRAVDYKAHVFINGSYVGSHEGAFAPFEFDVTAVAHTGRNQVLVKVENDYPMQGHVGDDGRKLDGDKVYASTGLGYDDPVLGWHHNPPGMGIYQGVQLEARSTLHINDIFVRPIKDSDTAEVWLEVNNTEAAYRNIQVQHSLYGRNFSQTVYTNAVYKPSTVHVPGVGDLAKPTDWEQKSLAMGKGVNFLRFRIHIPAAKRWNPETPWLYQLQLKLLNENGDLLDVAQQQFGMRSFRMDTVQKPKGAMYLNNRFIRLRGANTMGSFMQDVKRKDWQQLIDDILLAKIANMNYMRMTQFPVQQEVYDYCDRLGLMTQTDLPLFGVLRRNKWAESVRQAEEMERLVRSHPCNVMVSYINERFPNAEGAPQRHLDTYEDFEKFFKAADQ